MSCVRGFCPSFVTLQGAKPRRPQGAAAAGFKIPALPDAIIPGDFEPMAILVAGIGGTGVVTIGGVLTMAAHLDGKAGSSLDVTGLSQKYGAVGSHIRIAPSAAMLHAARIGTGEADVLLGCDLIVAAGADALSRLRPGLARAFVNTEVVPTSDFTSQPDWAADEAGLKHRLNEALGGRAECIDVTVLAQHLLGDAILSNMLLLGYAWQQGAIPVQRAAMEKAIQLNGVSTDTNLKAFALGRWLAHDNAAVRRLMAPAQVVQLTMNAGGSLAALIDDRARRLVDYQNAALADRYRQRMESVRRMLAGRSDADALVRQVATQYFRVLAVKDEFEVARLYSRPAFLQSLNEAFEGEFQVSFHLAGGPFGKLDKVTGKISKTAVGSWIRPAMRLLAGVRFLRGSWLDPFARGVEAQLNRRVRDAYEEDLDDIGHAAAQWPEARLRELLSWPASVRGYGHVRERQARAGFARRATARDAPAGSHPEN
ncbi:DUF6537 domain-containing protein [Cupriavidus basilensis]|uniref:DUF6537 domain-containing protein n=1 Tax=Cupriavidus basilensis TaxID=68895 RepID=UPI0039F6B4E8